MAKQAGIIASNSGALAHREIHVSMTAYGNDSRHEEEESASVESNKSFIEYTLIRTFMIEPLLNRFMNDFNHTKFCTLEQCREILVLTLRWKVSLNHFQE
jgi:hypothetical protein